MFRVENTSLTFSGTQLVYWEVKIETKIMHQILLSISGNYAAYSGS